ncbi:MAG: PorV/PorQ family protein, partial [Gammaproteobacteria bacterium]|nr:PorV/PorQ family protein [Gammaproteobacteria bacterium]NIW39799.1 PorV/PorQ family protein [candidate division Zixibacteria bacterium]NIX57584.1 PorV/PorQ family protein [candidate division Zixibacteria bacterium]
CARATALGEAYTVWATGAEAMFWNPAGLASLDNMEFSTTYINWLFDSQQGAFSYALSIGGFGALGIQIQYVDFGEFEETTNERPFINDPDNPGITGRTFNPYSYLVGISYARYLTDRFSMGISIKYAHESLFNGERATAQVRQGEFEEVDTWANGLLFDFGIRYNTGYRSVYLGSAVQNFGADVKYAKESSPVPLLFRFGVGADVIGPEGILITGSNASRLSMAYDIFHPNDYAQQMHVGAEYEYGGIFALRGGYKFNYDFDGFTLGAGFKHAIEGLKLSADYSYGDMGTYLGNVQRISLGIILP